MAMVRMRGPSDRPPGFLNSASTFDSAPSLLSVKALTSRRLTLYSTKIHFPLRRPCRQRGVSQSDPISFRSKQKP